MNLLKDLTGAGLAREKLKDFKHVVAVQTALILTAMVVRDLPGVSGISPAMPWMESLFFSILGLYVWFLWDLLRNYTRNRPLLIGLLVLIMGTFLEGVVVANPFFTVVEGLPFRILTGIIMCTLMLVELCVIVFTIREILVRELTISERLWGAVCIYLIIGIMFGSIYELVCIVEFNSLPMELPLGSSHFMKSISYSFLVLGGVERPAGAASDLVAQLSALESVWGNLFIVFVVGRLLYK